MLVTSPRPRPSLVPHGAPLPPSAPRAGRRRVPRETWSFGLALAAVLAVKAGWITSVPW